MENFDIARSAYETAANSAGSAMKEHEIWMDSLEAKTLQLKAAWEEMSITFLDSSLVKGVVDFGTTALSAITAVIDKVGALPTVLMAVGAALSFKNIGRDKMLSLIVEILPMVFVFYFYRDSFAYTLNEIH